jgi:DNA repair exonuclease SbcCD ATPase subunit
MSILQILPFIFIAGWAFFSFQYLGRARKDYSSVNPIIFDHIPAVFTTLGVFGTFLGIAFGLHGFDVSNIDASIPQLLDGLVVAFWSSILGIALSLGFQFFIQQVQNSVTDASGAPVSETQLLVSIASSLEEIRKAISSDADGSITTHLIKMRASLQDNLQPIGANMEKLTQAVGGDGETSMLTQIQKLRLESAEKQDVIISHQKEELAFMKSNSELVERKFDEFTELLKQSNTEALVEVIEKVIGGFNDKLNELIEKLVKENFEELNASVARLNEWQQENKEQVKALIDQYKSLTEQLTLSAKTLESVSKNTEKLVTEDGKLVKLIDELNTITTDGDNVFVKSVEKFGTSTEAYEKTSDDLRNWVEKHGAFTDKVDELIDRLDEIEQLRNRTEGFFADVKKEFEEAATILKQSNTNVREQVEDMRKAFQEGMDRSFVALDGILRTMVLETAQRLTNLPKP